MSTHQYRRRGAIALGAAGVALAGSVLFAAPASAHTPNWSVDCDSVSVSLKWYAEQGNTVTVSAGGERLLHQEFGADFHKQDLALPEHGEPLQVTLTVNASDHDRFDFQDTKTSPVCEGQEPSPSPSTPTEEPTPTPEPSTSEPTEPTEPTPSTSEPAVEPTEEETAPPTDLAETGSSDSTPLIAGIAAAVVAAGAGLLVVTRKRRATKA